jgi:hypothetical protein
MIAGREEERIVARMKLKSDFLLPHYGDFGGKAWGTDQFGHDPSMILNSQDSANYNHDVNCEPSCTPKVNGQWLKNSWQGNPNYLPPGPFGFAYKLLGTVTFWFASH